MPAPVHVIVDFLFKMKPVKYVKYVSALMLIKENPFFSINICNRLGNSPRILIDYAINHDFNEDIIERIIEGTIILYDDVFIDDEIREYILNKSKNLINGNETRKDFGTWFSNSLKIIHLFGVNYLTTILRSFPQTSLQIANEAMSLIIKIGAPEIANESLIKKGINELKKTANELKIKRFTECRNLEEILFAFKKGSNNIIPYNFVFDGTPVIKLQVSLSKLG